MTTLLTTALSLSLALMPALILTVPDGYNIAGITVFLLSLAHLRLNKPTTLTFSTKEKFLLASLILLPFIVALDVFFRDLRLRYLDYYLRFILVIPIFLALRQTKVNLTPFIIGIMAGAIGSGIFATYQFVYINPTDVHGHIMKINFGNISLLLGMMSFAGLLLLNEVRFKKIMLIVSLLAFVMGLSASVLSGTRGAWLSLPFFIGLFFIVSPITKKFKALSITALIIILFATYTSNDHFKIRINSAYNNANFYFDGNSQAINTSTGLRLEMWKAAWKIFREQPIFGIGSGRYLKILESKIKSGDAPKMHLFDHPHSEPLYILVSLGVCGFFAYLFLYISTSYYFYSSLIQSSTNTIKYLSTLGLMVVGSFFIFGLTNYSFGHQIMVIFFALVVASMAGVLKNLELDENTY